MSLRFKSLLISGMILTTEEVMYLLDQGIENYKGNRSPDLAFAKFIKQQCKYATVLLTLEIERNDVWI